MTVMYKSLGGEVHGRVGITLFVRLSVRVSIFLRSAPPPICMNRYC